jgi:nucleotide-binding universal stress UspA family protein
MTARILIGTDGSDDAVAAARRAAEVLAPDAIIHLVCVAQPPAAVSAGMESGFAGGLATPEELDTAWTGAMEEAEAALARTATVLGSATVEQSVEQGDPAAALCDLAQELGVDVVVIGSRGHGALKRALLGSVSSYVVHNAPCAVLVVRQGAA